MQQMKALSELLLIMGVKRAKSDFPLNSTILPDSATYINVLTPALLFSLLVTAYCYSLVWSTLVLTLHTISESASPSSMVQLLARSQTQRGGSVHGFSKIGFACCFRRSTNS